ncbi:MAG: c-type cytochrome domain-containing protein [Bacteroidota bacterium]|nr:c-type cytochrome domain-containing protein [Bacteroidota bacterium]
MNKLVALLIIIISGIVIFPSCKDETTDDCNIVFPDTATVRYLIHVQPLFDCSCAFVGCHGADTKETRGFSLDDYDNFMTGAPKQVIYRGNPDASPLILRVEGKLGARMPPDRPPLNQNQINGMRRWIANGAQLN